MFRDFYATAAQVLPVIMLALLGESRFLDRLRENPRRLRREDPVRGVLFWSRSRVRAYSIFISTLVLSGTGLAVLVLAGVVPDGRALRVALSGCTLLALGTLLVRVVVDVLDATRLVDSGAPQLERAGVVRSPGPGELVANSPGEGEGR